MHDASLTLMKRTNMRRRPAESASSTLRLISKPALHQQCWSAGLLQACCWQHVPCCWPGQGASLKPTTSRASAVLLCNSQTSAVPAHGHQGNLAVGLFCAMPPRTQLLKASPDLLQPLKHSLWYGVPQSCVSSASLSPQRWLLVCCS